MNRAVFLDRDNTIIHNDGDLGDPAQVRLIQGAAASIASLCGLGFKIIVVTNQGGVARGKYGEADVRRVHEQIAQLVRQSANGARIDRFYFCPYHPEGSVQAYRREHPNRKPGPGMLHQAAKELKLDLSQCWMVGDQMRDIQAGAAAGTRTILLQADLDPHEPIQKPAPDVPFDHGWQASEVRPDYLARSLIEAVRAIAQARHPEAGHDISRAHLAGRRWDAAAVAKLQRPRPTRPRSEAADIVAEPDVEVDVIEEADRSTAGKSVPADSEPASDAKETTPVFEAPTHVASALRMEEVEQSSTPTASLEGRPGTSGREDRGQAAADPISLRYRPLVSSTDVSPLAPPAAALDEKIGEPPARDDSSHPDAAEMNQSLRLILQELRHQHGARAEVSNLYLVAIVLQMVAAVCLLGGLWMGAHDDGLFLRWLAAGLLIQLATIAALLFSR